MSISTNIVAAIFGNSRRACGDRILFQRDRGQVLAFPDLADQLPPTFQVWFANHPEIGTAVPQTGADGSVAIPDTLIATGSPIWAWLYLHTGADDGETCYMVTILNTAQPAFTGATPTPAQASAWDEAIAELNEAIEAAEAAASHGPQIVNGFWYTWNAETEEYENTNVKADGEDGYSPVVTISSITGGHRVTITDEDHPSGQSFDVMNGESATIDDTLSIPGDAADAAATGAGINAARHTADYALLFTETLNSKNGIPLDIQWESGTISTAGSNSGTSQKYARTKGGATFVSYSGYFGNFPVDVTITAAPGYGFWAARRKTDGTYIGHTDWVASAVIPAGEYWRIAVRAEDYHGHGAGTNIDPANMLGVITILNNNPVNQARIHMFPDDEELPISAAHRGIVSNTYYQETMPAYEEAVSKGWRYLECDLRKTSDGVWVLLHGDTDLGSSIGSLTYEQAAAIELTGGTHVATFDELLDLCRRAHAYPIAEIKNSSITQAEADSIWEIVQKYGMENEVIWLCSSQAGVWRFLWKNPYATVVQTSSTNWSYIDPANFPSSAVAGAEYSSGRNKVFVARINSAFSSKTDMDNFVDWCHYHGAYAGVYGPSTQASVNALCDRLDLAITEKYKYEIERDYGGGGGGGISPYTSDPEALGSASPGSSNNYARGDHVHPKPSASDIGAAEVLWCTYGTTTSAEVEAAYQAGKIVLVENNSIVFLLTARISATYHVFTVATSAGTGTVVLNNNAWSTSSKGIPSASNSTPQALGTASAGSSSDFSRADHVHAKPTASDIGAVAVAQGVAHAGEFVVVGSDGNITSVTMSVWQGGSY